MNTADICDKYANEVRIVESIFINYGGKGAFWGQITTLKVFEDNTLVRQILEEPGTGRVLVIDGGGSLRCALVGDRLAALAQQNGWRGIVVYGCIRDAWEIAKISIGVKALNTHPLKSEKGGAGRRDIPVRFASATFTPGAFLYADADGIVLAKRDLSLES